MGKSNLERYPKVSHHLPKAKLTIDFKATKAGVSKSEIKVKSDEDTAVVKKEEEVCY